MNLGWLWVAVLLIGLVVPAGHAAAPRLTPAPLPGPVEKMGPPLVVGDPKVWVPVLLATGDVQAAAEAAQGISATYYDVSPLGDVNHDGHADFLVAARQHPLVEENDPQAASDAINLTAISGGTGATLWTRVLEKGQSWYSIGDIDLDGINDFVVYAYKATSSRSSVNAAGAGQSHSRSEYRTEYAIANGATGRTMFERASAGWAETNATFAGAALLFLDHFETSSYGEGPSAAAPGVEPGLDWITYRFETRYTFGALAVAFAEAVQFQGSSTVQRLDPAGKALWTTQPTATEGNMGLWLRSDLNGDRVPEYVYMDDAARGVYAGPVSANIAASGHPARVEVLDGRTGKSLWTWDAPSSQASPLDTAYAITNGGRASTGSTVIVTATEYSPAPPIASQSTLFILDGAKGSLLATRTLPALYASATAIGDVDHDGIDELLVPTRPASGSTVAASASAKAELQLVNRDFTKIWSRNDLPPLGYVAGYRDLDGDGALDPVFRQSQGNNVTVTAISSRDGSQLWNRTGDSRLLTFAYLPDLDGKGGVELGWNIVEAPAKDLPQSRSFLDETNLAPYAVSFEVRRGSDNALIWSALVREASNSGETLVMPYLRVTPAGDIDADGVPDFMYRLDSTMVWSTSCSGGVCTSRVIGDDEPLVNRVIAFSGANGQALASYPAEGSGVKVKEGVIKLLGTGKAAPAVHDAKSPSVAAPLVVAAAFLMALWPRRATRTR